VPNLDSLEACLLGQRWPLLLAEHLNYFNRRSLMLCGAKAGVVWLRFSRQPSFFSIGYIVDRLSQHRIPGIALCQRLAKACPNVILPIWLGEILAVGSRCYE